MRYVSVVDPGNTSTLRMNEGSSPNLSPDQIRIQVLAVGVNRADLLQRRGLYPPPPGSSEILGLECAGVVTEVGSDVNSINVGERVMALLAGGGYATEVVVPAGNAWRTSDRLSDVDAAAVPEAFLTAYHNLVQLPDLQPEQNVLIHGGSGGVGTAAIQLAKRRNARIAVTTGSDERCRECQSLGADLAVDYHHAGFWEELRSWAPDGVEVILDCIGAKYFSQHVDLLSRRGWLAIIGLMGGRQTEIDLAKVLRKNLTIRGTTLRSQSADDKKRLITSFLEAYGKDLDTGAIRPVVARTYPLERTDDAHKLLTAGGVFGKLVLTT